MDRGPDPTTNDAARAIQVASDWSRRSRRPRLGEPGFWQRPDVRQLRFWLAFLVLGVSSVVLAIRFEGTPIETIATGVFVVLLVGFFAFIVLATILSPVLTLRSVARGLRDTTEPALELQSDGPVIDERERRQRQRALDRRRLRILAPAVILGAVLALELWLRQP